MGCCILKKVCGIWSLEKGVVIVGIGTLVISITVLCTSFISIKYTEPKDNTYNKDPIAAFNLIFGMFCMSISMYQCIIAVFLLWYSLKEPSSQASSVRFMCTVWFVSHISILSLYAMMICGKIIVIIVVDSYFSAIISTVWCIFYMCIFSYFSAIIYSYMVMRDAISYQSWLSISVHNEQ